MFLFILYVLHFVTFGLNKKKTVISALPAFEKRAKFKKCNFGTIKKFYFLTKVT